MRNKKYHKHLVYGLWLKRDYSNGIGYKMHYILFYEFAPDYLSRRDEFRKEHVMLAQSFVDKGDIFLGGALVEPADGAIIVFNADSPEVAQNFAQADPYVRHGLVTNWYVREWATVIGKDAANPISN